MKVLLLVYIFVCALHIVIAMPVDECDQMCRRLVFVLRLAGLLKINASADDLLKYKCSTCKRNGRNDEMSELCSQTCEEVKRRLLGKEKAIKEILTTTEKDFQHPYDTCRFLEICEPRRAKRI
ncbi:unnamed protein product [Cylicocyclus nassatus]|uniref:Uncharacterized protein n=1 Tax=Cylicocyclus nassatus TaxID=53992 RepID=A0AA36GTE6_CYLNA|nr:unnamed protein product [Cylicocyclus nassatus]